MWKKFMNLFKRKEFNNQVIEHDVDIVCKDDDFIYFTSEQGLDEEEVLDVIYKNLLEGQ